MTLAEFGGWPQTLTDITGGKALSGEHAAAAMAEILDGAATSAQIAGFCVGLRGKGVTVDEVVGLLQSLLDHAEKVPLGDVAGVIDTCGTGGDRHGTINVSTAAALVVAGAGVRVCKHGNRAASSACGSADVLEALDVAIDLGPAEVALCVREVGMGFCFAPRFHSALRHAGPTRKELGIPTVFNFLGPLANPARVRRQVLGVNDPNMAETMVHVLEANGAERALVLFGHDGLDELTLTTTSTIIDLKDGEIRTYEVDPNDLGLPRRELSEMKGGDPATNAEVVRRVLDGTPGAHRDLVVLNAAAGLVSGGMADDLRDGVEAATAAIDDGRAAGVLDRLVSVSREQAALAV